MSLPCTLQFAPEISAFPRCLSGFVLLGATKQLHWLQSVRSCDCLSLSSFVANVSAASNQLYSFQPE